MDAMRIVDMQAGLLNGAPKHDLAGVIARINRLAAQIRAQSGKVILIRHCANWFEIQPISSSRRI
jgi:nicotinamidase-related amidase